jgi:hypothetical protein
MLEKPLYAHALPALIQLQTTIVLTVSQIVKLVQMQHPATLANQRPPRQWQEFLQLVTAQQITKVSQILIVLPSVWLNVRHALTWFLVTLVKKQFLNKTLEKPLYAHALPALIQLQIMIVRIVSQIVRLVQMQHPATLANQHPPRQWQEIFQIVLVLYFILVNQISTVYHVWINVRPVQTRFLVTLVKKQFLNKTLEKPLYAHALPALIQLQTTIVLTVSQIVKLVRMQHPAALANQRPPRLWQENFQIVPAQLIIIVNPILTVCLIAYLNARPALI